MTGAVVLEFVGNVPATPVAGKANEQIGRYRRTPKYCVSAGEHRNAMAF